MWGLRRAWGSPYSLVLLVPLEGPIGQLHIDPRIYTYNYVATLCASGWGEPWLMTRCKLTNYLPELGRLGPCGGKLVWGGGYERKHLGNLHWIFRVGPGIGKHLGNLLWGHTRGISEEPRVMGRLIDCAVLPCSALFNQSLGRRSNHQAG